MNNFELVNPLSYKSIQNSIKNFRHLKGDNFNLYDEPGSYWFKPIFYFYRSGIETDMSADFNNEGLLHPSWLDGDVPMSVNDTQESRQSVINNRFASSAYNYLIRNDEPYRAKLLKQFITLLSNISSRSPWYFQSITGLDTAMDRSEQFKTGKFVSDERKQITFTLLPDAIDTRIGTLFDLYRTICYSWQTKRENLPANLRKFDMGIYIFNSMIQNDHSNILHSQGALTGALELADQLGIGYEPDTEIVDASGQTKYRPGDLGWQSRGMAHTYIEFVNCEIDLSSLKGGDEISNAEGSQRVYTMTINYDTCYINRYNDFIVGAIGDSILDDMLYYGTSRDGEVADSNIGRHRTNTILGSALTNVVDNTISATWGNLKKSAEETVGSILLGNLYHGSLTKSTMQVGAGRLDALAGVVNNAITPETYTRAGNIGKESLESALRQNKEEISQNANLRSSYSINQERKTDKKVESLGSLNNGNQEKETVAMTVKNLYDENLIESPSIDRKLTQVKRNLSNKTSVASNI